MMPRSQLLLLAITTAQASNFFEPVEGYLRYALSTFPEPGPVLSKDPHDVKLLRAKPIFSSINQKEIWKPGDLVWPSLEMKHKAGANAWGEPPNAWKPEAGMEARVVHVWKDRGFKWLLHVTKDDKYVVVGDSAIHKSKAEGIKAYLGHHVDRNDPRHPRNQWYEQNLPPFFVLVISFITFSFVGYFVVDDLYNWCCVDHVKRHKERQAKEYPSTRTCSDSTPNKKDSSTAESEYVVVDNAKDKKKN
jgi:hypothetical protein